jgi:DNA/RNA-binding domain of Phe-tRNA-synthetase-like protein
MIKLVVYEDAYKLGIYNPVACLIRNITVTSELCDVLDDSIQNTMDIILNHSDEILTKPEARGFNTFFEKLGYPDQISAGKRLIESFKIRGFKSYNNIIDSYNIASILFVSGLGLHDANNVMDDIHIFRANGGEIIKPIFQNKQQKIPHGDLIYASGGKVLAWLGKKDVDSDYFKVTYKTTHLLLIALGNENTSAEYNRTACITAIRLIRKSCPKVYGQFIQTIVRSN